MSPARILVVEDNPIARKAFRVALAAEGHEVLEAGDGREALAHLAAGIPDLVLQDLALPDVDGFELVRRLRAVPGAASIPILACSGLGSMLDRDDAATLGFTDFVLKPVEPSRLAALVRRYLDPAAGPAPAPGEGRRVLVVDDDPARLQALRAALARRGFEVSTAPDGERALARALETPPDAIASHVRVPQTDGFRRCLAARGIPCLPRVPLVLYGEGADGDAAAVARKVGASAVVPAAGGPVVDALVASLGSATGASAGPEAAEPAGSPAGAGSGRGRAGELGMHAALQAAALTALAGVSEALAADATLPWGAILARCLDVAGIATGALYPVGPGGRLERGTEIGYLGDAARDAEAAFGHAAFLSAIAARGAPAAIPGAGVDPEVARALLARAGGISALAVPLAGSGECLGLLLLVSDWADLGSGHWLAFGQALSTQLGQAMRLARRRAEAEALAQDNARLHAESEQRRRAAESLADLARLLSESLDPEVVAERAVASLERLLGASSAILYRLDPERGDLRPAAVSGALASFLPRSLALPPGTGVAGLAVRDRCPVATPDLLADPRVTLPTGLRGYFERASCRAVLAVPLLARERAIGALAVADRQGRLFDAEHARLAQAFAAHAAVALDNARVFAEATRRRAEAEALAASARTLTETLDAATVAERIVERVRALFETQSAVLRLLEPDGSLVVRAAAGPAAAQFPPGHATPPGSGLADTVLADGRAFQTPNVLDEPRIALPEDVRRRIAAAGDYAVLAVALRVEGAPLGVLYLSDPPGRTHDARAVALLQAFADQAALAIHNAALLEERRRREEALRAAEARLRFLLTAGPAVIYTARASGDFGATFVSENVRDQTGYEAREFVEDPGFWQSHVHPDDLPRVAAAFARLRETGGVAVEYRFHHRDGDDRWMYDEARLVRDEHGEPAEIIGYWVDVTERKRLEHQLVQAQKMEAVGRLAGGIAHDFNNQLTVVLGRSEMLLERLPPEDPRRRPAQLIRETAERAAGLTRQLLAFSRKQVLEPKVLDLNQVVGGMEKMLRRLIGEDVELTLAPGAGLGAVSADPGQLEQVVMNLAVNARDAMPQGGRLLLRTANAELDTTACRRHADAAPGRYVMLEVTDTGVGMDAATQARIFEPFFTTKEAGKGTGLGLATVFGIVKQSNGHIWVYSEPGHGTTFKVLLPRIEGEADGAPAETAAARRGSETILLAEDEPELRALVAEHLEARGYTVLAAATPEEALGLARAHAGPIHLLLTDVVMPGLSGRALSEQFRAERPEARVLYMSGYTDEIIGHHGLLEAGTALLQKPFTGNALALKVREVLDAPERAVAQR